MKPYTLLGNLLVGLVSLAAGGCTAVADIAKVPPVSDDASAPDVRVAAVGADASRPDESTIVVVEQVELEVQDHLIVFRIEASHFLWRMVRRLVGVLVRLGAGQIQMADFEQLLAGRCESRLDVAAWTAPSSGLFLEDVRYESGPKTV